jgi:CheY-like chemotaxis protein
MLEIRKSENLLQQLQNDHLLILIVDDNESDLVLLHRHLIKLGIHTDHIISFEDPQDLLNFTRENLNHIALIISDLEMPRINGLELFIELIKLLFSGQFIIYSGADQDTIEKEKKQFPADSFVNVPMVEKTASTTHDRHQLQRILESLVCVET